jgi:hypothetical protein
MDIILNSETEEKKQKQKPKPKMKDIFQIPHGMQKVINKKEMQLKKKKKDQS